MILKPYTDNEFFSILRDFENEVSISQISQRTNRTKKTVGYIKSLWGAWQRTGKTTIPSYGRRFAAFAQQNGHKKADPIQGGGKPLRPVEASAGNI